MRNNRMSHFVCVTVVHLTQHWDVVIVCWLFLVALKWVFQVIKDCEKHMPAKLVLHCSNLIYYVCFKKVCDLVNFEFIKYNECVFVFYVDLYGYN